MSQHPANTLPESPLHPVHEIPPPGNITTSSEAQYRRKAEALRRYSEGKRSRDPEEPVAVSIFDAVSDLIARTDLAGSSLMAYRSAMLWYLRALQDQSESNRLAYAMLLNIELPENGKAARTKKKAIPEDDYNQLINELSDMATTSIWARRAQAWVQATLASGARPIEWLDATFADPERTRLAILTAKQHLDAPRFMDGRGAGAGSGDSVGQGAIGEHGSHIADHQGGTGADGGPAYMEAGGADAGSAPDDDHDQDDADGETENFGDASPMRVAGAVRIVPLAAGIDQVATDSHMAHFIEALPRDMPEQKRFDDFHKYYDQCRWVLRKACHRLWKGKKNYTLYTFRGQFQANQRARLGAAAAAGLMGHFSETSPSTAHYGKANQAFRRFKGERAANERQAEAVTEQGGEPGEQGEAGEQGQHDAVHTAG